MEKLLEEIEKFAESAENSRIRAELWGDFVNWENRWKEDERFLLPILRQYGVRSALDLALGDGVDTVFLLKQGFDIKTNEIDDAFRAKAIENAKKHGFVITQQILTGGICKKAINQNHLMQLFVWGIL